MKVGKIKVLPLTKKFVQLSVHQHGVNIHIHTKPI